MSKDSISPPEGRKDDGDENLEAWMDNAAMVVKVKAEQVESDLVAPMFETYQHYAKTYPLISFFITTFVVLSIVPVVSYLVFSFVVFSSLGFIAVTTAVLTALGICAFVGFFLLFSLALTLGVASFATAAYFGTTITYRLYFHLTSREGDGIAGWIIETFERFRWSNQTDSEWPRTKDSEAVKTEHEVVEDYATSEKEKNESDP